MRITVQNGAKHGLSRREAEAIVQLLPASWNRLFQSIVLYQGTGPEVQVVYYAHFRTLGLLWPVSPIGTATKANAIEALLVAMSLVAERGELPSRPSKSLHARHMGEVTALCESCVRAVAGIAA